MKVSIVRCLLVFLFTAPALADDGQVTFVSELSSKPAQKLSKYGWYGNVRLQRFHIPEETAVVRWLFTVTKNNSFNCRPYNVSIYLQWGAPPVINPIETVFPKDTLWIPPHSLTLPVPVTLQSSTTFNLSSPAAGDWYIAAHLPEDDGRIEQKGFPSCSYFFQPQLSLRKAVDTPVLEQGTVLQQTTGPDRAVHLKLYVPEFSSSVSVLLTNCSSEEPRSENCSMVLRLGSRALQGEPLSVSCSGTHCTATLPNPPWDMWLQVVVETKQSNRTVTFNIVSNYTVRCKPKSVGLAAGDEFRILRGNIGSSISTSAKNSSEPSHSGQFSYSSATLPPFLASACVWNVPVLSEELDVLSVRYTPINGANISITNAQPTLLSYPLHTGATGGTLNLQLTLNSTNATLGNDSSVVACLSPWTPVLELNHCTFSGLFKGYSVRVDASVPKAVVRLPYPQSATWYLTLLLTCNGTDCGNASVVSVVPELFVSACVEDCGTYGECRLIRSFTYLYAACSCKAGWSGWGCTDDAKALSFSRQILAALMLTISNLFFIPAIVVAVRRCYICEASVYLFTMFFSTFYHACDQPGVAVMCIMDYDALQYCDFLGSVCSIWVTILCMARIKDTFKYALFMLGALLLAMSMQLDRKGLWNMLGPVFCALLILVAAWVYRGVKRHHCYPPSWRRWVFFLLPGALCALIAVSVFVFAQTEDNYYYTHSLWHVLVAVCVVFLMPPKERNREGFGWTQGFSWTWSWRPSVCGYTLCDNDKDELYTVT
ncbi:post-GPI attachment to proteins factor 6 isoform X2 [Eucyclogobius newberryi]|uniref:post-GPI attachment to proteins factor 6 isoform X2 n=1 Tax=Eucyclogobius newberryi TaxID=166745 RepID=UPI003B5C6516